MPLARSRCISIHAPHTRSDAWRVSCTLREFEFQSTLLIRGATSLLTISAGGFFYFNPRSSYEERLQAPRQPTGGRYFNPRSSYEERLSGKRYRRWLDARFQSTLLIRGATMDGRTSEVTQCLFQSTLLIRGATCPLPRSCPGRGAYFNPRSSYEERLSAIVGTAILRDFNPRSSYEERPSSRRSPWRRCNFNPRSSYEERPHTKGFVSL